MSPNRRHRQPTSPRLGARIVLLALLLAATASVGCGAREDATAAPTGATGQSQWDTLHWDDGSWS